MPRNDMKAYTSMIARIPQELADEVKRYASVHRCTVSELIRDGLEMRLESGEVPGRSTGSSTDHGEEVLHEVLQVLPKVVHELSPMLLAQMQDTIRTTVTEVLQGITEVLHDKADFAPTRFVLGKLCINQHAYKDTGQTLYRLPKHVCPQCDAQRARERRARQKAGQQAG